MKKWLRLTLVVLLSILSLVTTTPVIASPGWLSDWDQRVKLTIDNTDIDAALSNFPILVYLSASSGRNSDDVSFVFDELTSDDNRKKIAITRADGITECYVEIEKWDDANEQAWLWVKVLSVASGADTDLYLYYDITQADNDTYVGDTNDVVAENVWGDGYFITHFKDDPNNTHIRDSSSYSSDGDKRAANQPIEAAGDKTAYAQDFNSANPDYIEIPADQTQLDFTSEDFSLIMRFKLDTLLTTQMLFTRGAFNADGWYFFVDSSSRLFFRTNQLDAGQTTRSNASISSTSVYYTAGFSRSGEEALIYIDGVEDVNIPATHTNPTTSARTAKIGIHDDKTQTPTDGKIEFLGVFGGVSLTAAFHKAFDESITDDLLAFDGEEYALTLPPTNFMLTINGNNILGSWTLGQHAITTIVIRGENRFPDSLTDGTEVYNDIGTSFTDTDLGVELTQYYYSAWSHNDGGYSADYAEDSIGGEGMLTIGVIVLVLVLTVVAFWRKEPMLYMVGVIGWLFMTFYLANQSYPAENEYLKYAMAVFCLSMTLVMAVQVLNVYFPGGAKWPTYNERQAAYKSKVAGLTRKGKKSLWEE